MTDTAVPQPDITAKSWVMIGTLGVVWGAAFLGIEIALEGITPFWLAAGRLIAAAAVLALFWRISGGAPPPRTTIRRHWPRLLLIAAFSSTVPFTLLALGQQTVTSGFAGVSMAAVPLFVLPLAHVFLPGESLTWARAGGFVVGFLGVLVLIGGKAFDSSGATYEWAGRLACLGAGLSYAVSSILMRRFPPIAPATLAMLLTLGGAVISVIAALIIEGVPEIPPTRPLMALLLLGLIPTGLANILRVTVIRTAGPPFMTLTNFMVPVWSVLFGTLILGETLPPSLFLALALILAALAISNWRTLVRLRHR